MAVADEGLFDGPARPGPLPGDGRVGDERLLRHFRSFVAPVAADSGAVVEDPRALQLARDMSEVFPDHPGVSGMTKAEVQRALTRRRQ